MLTLENVVWSTPDGERIINGISYTAGEGKLIVVTGPNGGGKTSIAKLIAGIERPESGRILFGGEDITDLNITGRAKKGIAYAFQQPVRFKGLTVKDILELASGGEMKYSEICDLLGKVGLCANEYVSRELNSGLSGGEMKRIEIATVLARKAPFSVFDEPEAGIDLWSFSRLVETFKKMRAEQNGTLLIISHQERILEIADEIVVIANGKIRDCGKGGDILPSLLKSEMTSICPRGKENA